MSYVIGIDEAGLGPNLGPYVVTATVWQVSGAPGDVDLWQASAEAVTGRPEPGDARLHIGDSKAVFQPGRGLAALERGVLAALGMISTDLPATDRDLRRRLSDDGNDQTGSDPWYADDDLLLPTDGPTGHERTRFAVLSERWRQALQCAEIRLTEIRSEIIEPQRFNALIDVHQNKAAALSTVSLQLLKQATSFTGDQPVLAWCDKHGGRNRYDQLLSACYDDAFVFRLHESAELSSYRLGKLEVRFLPRAESHLPVALASMVSKYVRELAMARFNRFWRQRLPGLKPTQGYPVDARRFREAIAAEQQRLGLPDVQLWRCR